MFKLIQYLHKISVKQIALCGLSLVLISCSSVEYYSSLLHGHAEVLNQARDIDEVLADESVDIKTRNKLLELKNAREFAINELFLPDSGSYRQYADIGRNYVVWNVIATRELSVEPHEWCFLIVGCIQYRGYYSREAAQRYANQLAKNGYDIYVTGVSAYSTLGWFDDPLLNTMMYRDTEDRLNLLFHEMAHQKIFIKDDSKFNEAFATVVAKVGVLRWQLKNSKTRHIERYQQKLENKERFYQLLRKSREELKDIYQRQISDDEKRNLKIKTFTRLKQRYILLKQNFPSLNYDRWMKKNLNNAHLALIATYNTYVPYFEKKLSENEGNLLSFYKQIDQLSKYDEFRRKQLISGN